MRVMDASRILDLYTSKQRFSSVRHSNYTIYSWTYHNAKDHKFGLVLALALLHNTFLFRLGHLLFSFLPCFLLGSLLPLLRDEIYQDGGKGAI